MTERRFHATAMVAHRLATILTSFAAHATAQITQQNDCYAHFERDGQPCDDGNPATANDQCYQGACGDWMDVSTVISSEAERLQWVAR